MNATKTAVSALRLRSTLVFALLAHVPLVAFARRAPAPPPLAGPEIVIVMEEPPLVTHAPPPVISVATSVVASNDPPRPTSTAGPTATDAPVGAREGDAIVAMAPAATVDVWGNAGRAPRAGVMIDLPAGAVPPPAPSSPSTPEARARPAAETAMRAALDARDRAAGLGRAGPLVSAAHSVAMASRIPATGAATLFAVVDAEGKVVDVRTSVEDAAWKDLAASLRRAMEAKRVRVPPGARGLEIAIRIESRVRTAGGHVRREDDRGGHGSVDDKSPDRDRPPSLALGTPTYRCLEGCTASGNIDPTDALLGATAKNARTIEVQILSEKRL